VKLCERDCLLRRRQFAAPLPLRAFNPGPGVAGAVLDARVCTAWNVCYCMEIAAASCLFG
jgi:hypothetical protein